uniref:Uncharacterized protein n=1 Tax=Sus scrofa TaxID=9823 RepID=A0A8D0WVL4_PIG
MAVFVDLDLRAGSDLKALRGLVENAAYLGYSVVAINHVVEFKEKKQEIEKPVAVSELFTTLPVVQGKSKPIKILTRLTIIVSDPSHCNVLRTTSSRVRLYDIIAVFPKTEKLFHVACTHLDVDIVCITVTEKLPFYFKRPPINVVKTCINELERGQKKPLCLQEKKQRLVLNRRQLRKEDFVCVSCLKVARKLKIKIFSKLPDVFERP